MKQIPTTEPARREAGWVWGFGTASDRGHRGQAEVRALPGISPAGRVMLHGSRAGPRVGEELCQPARAFARDADSGPRLWRDTPTQLQKKLMKGRLQLARGGDRASRDPSSAVTEDTRSKFLKAHHKLSSIWEPVFLAGPTQRLQTRVKQR